MYDDITFSEELWAGSQTSFDLAMSAIAKVEAYVSSGNDDEDPEVPYTFEMQGAIGIISINGPLVNRDSPYNRYFGITSYAEIRRALLYAASNPEVKTVLLMIESGGGAANGVSDTAQLIQMIDSKVKPVYAFSGGAMLSAAYWLGVSARQTYTSSMTAMGSVGVITTFISYAKQMKEAGMDVHVMRAGKFKALANPMEPLSEEAKAQIQSQLDAVYKVFAGWCASQLSISLESFDAKLGQGREFFGEEAVTVGMAAAVTTYDALISKLTNKIDKAAQKEQTSGSFQRGISMAQALTEQQVAALAAGGGAPPQPTEAEKAAAAAALAESEAAAATAAAAALAATEATAAAAALAAAAKPTPDAVVTLLQSQLATAQAQVVALTVEATALRTKTATLEATHAPLVEIAGRSLKNMKTALGHSGFDASKLTAEAILAEHSPTAELFSKQFPAGGVAAVTQPKGENPTAAADHTVKNIVAANRYVGRGK